jgi:hypothetical protein
VNALVAELELPTEGDGELLHGDVSDDPLPRLKCMPTISSFTLWNKK